MEFVMYFVGALTVLSAAGVVLASRSLHSALSLVATLCLVAVHFALLGAEFLAALQIMVYAGAIMVLVVFVVMLLGLDKEVESQAKARDFRLPRYLAIALTTLFAAIIGFAAHHAVLAPSVLGKREAIQDGTVTGTAQGIGQVLFTEYVFPFEITGLLLLAAIIGAVLLAHDKKRPLAKGRGLRAMHEGDEVG